MNTILKLGKYLFAVPFAVFGISHIFKTAKMNELIGNPPGGMTGVVVSGILLTAAVICIIIGKLDKTGGHRIGRSAAGLCFPHSPAPGNGNG